MSNTPNQHNTYSPHSDSLLGQHTDYPTTYSPTILFPIARQLGRSQIVHAPNTWTGIDIWHGYEVSWLNAKGIPQVAVAQFIFDANNPFIVESKSFKLYLNSINFTTFASVVVLKNTLQQDLSQCVQGQVSVNILDVETPFFHQSQGICLDHLDISGYSTHPDPTQLKLANALTPLQNVATNSQAVSQTIYSHLLRSTCPVTNQPDWGTVIIKYTGQAWQHESVLQYILSYRQHQGFHEQCVEHIYSDLLYYLQPHSLMVYAAYTRRGGLDIHPCRATHAHLLNTQGIRLTRQ